MKQKTERNMKKKQTEKKFRKKEKKKKRNKEKKRKKRREKEEAWVETPLGVVYVRQTKKSVSFALWSRTKKNPQKKWSSNHPLSHELGSE